LEVLPTGRVAGRAACGDAVMLQTLPGPVNLEGGCYHVLLHREGNMLLHRAGGVTVLLHRGGDMLLH
jgi:hypothetical protein